MGRVYFVYKCMSERIRWKHIDDIDFYVGVLLLYFLSELYCLFVIFLLYF